MTERAANRFHPNSAERVLTAKSPPGSFEFPGLHLSEGMLAHLRSRNVPILLGHRVTEAVQTKGGRVVGVKAEHDGSTRFIRARRGVVFASGGFAHDRDKLRSFLRGPIFGSCSVTTSKGAFVDIADHGSKRMKTSLRKKCPPIRETARPFPACSANRSAAESTSLTIESRRAI